MFAFIEEAVAGGGNVLVSSASVSHLNIYLNLSIHIYTSCFAVMYYVILFVFVLLSLISLSVSYRSLILSYLLSLSLSCQVHCLAGAHRAGTTGCAILMHFAGNIYSVNNNTRKHIYTQRYIIIYISLYYE